MPKPSSTVVICAWACLLGAAVLAAPAPLPRHKKPDGPAARLVRAMESYRTQMPPAQGLGEENGRTIRELEPYLMSHLAGVARRMKIRTRAECVALMPYLKDRDCKLRFIASLAINEATDAWPSGLSVECFVDTSSAAHAEMLRRFTAAIGRLDR